MVLLLGRIRILIFRLFQQEKQENSLIKISIKKKKITFISVSLIQNKKIKKYKKKNSEFLCQNRGMFLFVGHPNMFS